MAAKKELVCIVCPIGCRMAVTMPDDASGKPTVEGNACPRGAEYAIRECTAPTRTVPSTVAIRGAFLPRLPVKTALPVPKARIMACMEQIRRVVVDAPVETGAVIIDDVAGTGVALVATRSMGRVGG